MNKPLISSPLLHQRVCYERKGKKLTMEKMSKTANKYGNRHRRNFLHLRRTTFVHLSGQAKAKKRSSETIGLLHLTNAKI